MSRIGVKFVYRDGVQSVDFWCQSGVRWDCHAHLGHSSAAPGSVEME